MSEPILRTRELTRRFGGLVAVDKASLELHVGEVHAVIGPNGAGKSTLTNLLSGDLSPSSGEIRYAGADLAGLPSHRISKMGIGRSYQKTNIFLPFSVFENCRLAAQSRAPRPWRVWAGAGAFADTNRLAEEAMEAAGLAHRVPHHARGLADAVISPGDRIALVPPGVPGPHRFCLGIYQRKP